jgi:hypothetical protein
MLAQIEFESQIKNETITVPAEYLEDISNDVIVVLKKKDKPVKHFAGKNERKGFRGRF